MTKRELWEKAKMLPLLPGVYIIRDKTGEIIYIGKAKRLRTRVSQYFREGVPHDAKVTKMIQNAFEFDVIVTQSEFEALVLECSQIKQHKPKYNILLKDDKGYSYVKVTREAYPRISAALQKDDDNADYIGPYTSSFAVREMVETACNVFRLPRCSKKFPQDIGKGRPCLNAHIVRCMAVCSGKISREDYNEAVQSAVHMIRRGQGEILKLLRERMADAAERLDFERAALIRDQIAAIEKVSRGQKVVRSEVDEPFCVSERDVWWTKESFCFTTPKTSPPCGRSFCPAIIWRTTSSSRRALPWMSCPRVRASLRACWARRGAARCGCMCLSGAIPPVWWRWRAPMPWNVWHGRADAMPANRNIWTNWPRCWA